MVLGTRENIINALFRFAAKHPDDYNITIADVASEAHISRQAIYKKHYSTVETIIEDIHEIISSEFQNELDKFSENSGDELFPFVIKNILPLIYRYRTWLKILYTTSMDPHWLDFVEKRYSNWLSPHIKVNSNLPGVTQVFLRKYISKQIISLISLWISEEIPDPPEVFSKKFLKILEHPTTRLINTY